jgi:hypothetical protein
VLKLIISHNTPPLQVSVFMKQLAANAGILLADLRKSYNNEVKRINHEHAERKAEESGVVMFPVNGDFNDQINATKKGIKKYNNPPKVFLVEEDIVYVDHKGDGKGLYREKLDKDRFKGYLQKCINFYQQTDSGRIVRSVPLDLATHMYTLPRAELPIPHLKAIRKHPILSVDGELNSKHGFDKYTGIYLDTQGHAFFKVPDEPTEEDLDEAYDLLFAYDGLFGDFPFKDDGDDESDDPDRIVGESTKAHVLALLLLPMIREVIDGPTPAFVINKPMPGAGSGLFANVFNLVLNNEVCPTFAPPSHTDNGAEFQKTLIGKMDDDPDSPMFFDNCTRIDDKVLASAITSGRWVGRELGSNNIARFDVHHVWLFSGNNISPSPEMSRRMIPINIMPNMARPELRTNFYHSDLVGWTRKHRADLIWALSVFIKNWVAKGMPEGSGRLGSFEAWSRVTSGILEAAGVGGFLGNLASWYVLSGGAAHDDSEVMAGLMKDAGLGKQFKPGELFDMIYDEGSNTMDVPVPITGRGAHGLRISFGRYLGKMKNNIFEIEGRQIKLKPGSVASGGALRYYFEDVTSLTAAEIKAIEEEKTPMKGNAATELKREHKAKMEERLSKNAD